MSQVKKAEMAKAAAFNVIASQVYNPVFFSKLAAYGIVPENEEQANTLLNAAANVRMAALETFGSVAHGAPDAQLLKHAQEIVEKDRRVKSAAVIMALTE